MFTFNNIAEDSDNNQDNDWAVITNTDLKNLQTGEPYLLLVRGDRSTNLTQANPTPTNTILRAKGDMFIGSHSPLLSNVPSHYSMIANPYQANIDFREVSKSNLTDFIYVYDASVDVRGEYVVVDLSDINNVTNDNPDSDANAFFAPGQSVFVQNTIAGNGSLTIEETDKNTSATEVTVFNTNTDFIIRSSLFHLIDAQNSLRKDAIMLRFDNAYTTLANDEDASKFFSPDENLSIVNNGLRSIDKQAMPVSGHEVNLSVDNYLNENFKLSFTMENQPNDLVAYLVDNYLNIQQELTPGFEYSYTVDGNIPQSIAADRFNLSFENTTLGVNEDNFGESFTLYPNPTNDDRFSIKTPNLSGEVTVKLTNMLGQQVKNEILSVVGNEVNVYINGLSTGVYIVELSQDQNTFSSKLIVE